MPLSEYINNRDGVAGLRFIRRMYLMRMLGTLLCFIPILSVLTEHRLSLGWLLLLGGECLCMANGGVCDCPPCPTTA